MEAIFADWQDTLHHGDCLEVLPKIPDHSVNLIFVDLPYGCTANKWDVIIPMDRLWAEYKRILVPKGQVVLTSQGMFTAELMVSNKKWFRYKMVWAKNRVALFLSSAWRPMNITEDILLFSESGGEYNPQMGKGYDAYSCTRGFGGAVAKNFGVGGTVEQWTTESDGSRFPQDIIKFPSSPWDGGSYHPTQKPVNLARWVIRTYTNKGDTVLDHCMGSGSIPLGAWLEGRHYIGVEQNQEYYDIACRRLAEAKASPPLFFDGFEPIESTYEYPMLGPKSSARRAEVDSGQWTVDSDLFACCARENPPN
jgi:site-specific DNA-methyltransferase (adenine-specific)/modification methylase